MSAHDVIPDAADTATEDPADLEEWLAESFEEVAEINHGRRSGDHDADGYYAELAGSAACLAWGHAAHVDEGHPLFEEWAEGHPPSWDGERLCDATAYGTACTGCEADCGLFFEPVSLWTLPGVTGGVR